MAALNPLDVFAKVEKAKVFGASQYIEPGRYQFKILKIMLQPSARDDDKLFFIAEMETVKSDQEHTPVGSTRSEVIDLSNKESGPSNVKAFAMCLAADVDESDITKEDLAALVSDEQPATGTIVACEAWMITTRKNTPFTKKKWSFVSSPDEDEEDED